MIIGGPPCQGWSALNRNRNKEIYRSRRESIATYMSYVELYRPKYLLLENYHGPGESEGKLSER